jgi:methylthioribose-1-phosphate isomerase
MAVKTIQWKGEHVRIIDQTCLPEKLTYIPLRTVDEMAEAIRTLRVRGAPAIGIAGAMGVVLAAYEFKGTEKAAMKKALRQAIKTLGGTRPTAVNLFWALDRMETVIKDLSDKSVEGIRKALLNEALAIFENDRAICRQLGRNGAALLPDPCTVITHCNAGALATADFGTALGVIYSAAEAGKEVKVYADETRPLLQGSRLTSWELMKSGIDVTVICDSTAPFIMQTRKVNAVIVGADRIAVNGDTANKIGTYGLAVSARQHGIPFYVAAPVSTFDREAKTGADIPIEERSGEEVIAGFGRKTGPKQVKVYNPAFDITPHSLISGIITEVEVFRRPYSESLRGIGEV